jgi:hypothetical protein
MPTGDTKRLHCNACGQATLHTILHEEKLEWEDSVVVQGEEMPINGGSTHRMVRCCGCEDVHFLTTSWFSENADEHGRPYLDIHRYPPAIARRAPSWFSDLLSLPPDTQTFLGEIYAALQNHSLRLCVLGIRALLEEIMIEKVGDQGALGRNIDAFIAAGFVAPKTEEIFRKNVIEAGNAAMHRGYRPRAGDVNTLLDITEGLVASIYVHPYRAAKVGKKIPPRKQ